MNKYTELSDFEVNKKIAVALGMENDYATFKPFDRYAFDPCNNPADAMPVIIENRISLSSMYDGENWISESLFYHDLYAVNKNPLRAAMEVFLLMKDAENE